jgi:hypothetical protein
LTKGEVLERGFLNKHYQKFIRRLKIEYNDGDQGDWDLSFNGIRFEIKTSSIDVNKKFQNED